MKKIVFTLALSIVMLATCMAQEKLVAKASANTTSIFETTGSYDGGSRSERPFIKGARFNVYFLLGLHIFNPTLGVRIFDYGFVGVQIGYTDLEMLFSNVVRNNSTQSVNMFTQGFPIMLDFRGYFPINKDVHPYIEYAFGWSPEFIVCESYNGDEDWMYEYNDWFNKTRLGVGFDIKRLSLGFGWNRNWGYENNGSIYKRDYFYMKIGVKVGRRD